MRTIRLEDAVRAAWSLSQLETFPDLPGIYLNHLWLANGMSPWLRLALGDEAAQDIERSGAAANHMGVMLGMADGDRRIAPVLSAPEEEKHAIRLVDHLCRESKSTKLHMFLHFQGVMMRGTPADRFLQPMRDAIEADPKLSMAPLHDWVPGILRAMAEHLRIVLEDVPVDLSAWSERQVDAVVTKLIPEVRGQFGHVLTDPYAVLRCADGVERQLFDGRGTVRSGAHLYPGDLAVGSRLRLTFVGATSGHPGYLRRVEDYALIDLIRSTKDYLAQEERHARETADFENRMARGNRDATGQLLSGRMRVALTVSCLEAEKGTEGWVDELLGDIVVVDFGGRIGKVPCYPDALRSLEAAA